VRNVFAVAFWLYTNTLEKYMQASVLYLDSSCVESLGVVPKPKDQTEQLCLSHLLYIIVRAHVIVASFSLRR
jgi:hypothetical protein